MSVLAALAGFVASYLAGGGLTVLALALTSRGTGRATGRTLPARTAGAQVRLKEFTLWPCVVLMGVVFALLALLRERRSWVSPTPVGRAAWAAELALVLALGCLVLPFYAVLNLGWAVFTAGGRPPRPGASSRRGHEP